MLMALAGLAGCKKFSVECELVLQPRVMISSGSDPLTPAYMARVYAFYIDDDEYLRPDMIPSSYADAEAGVIRNGTQMRSYSLAGEQQDDTFVHLVLTKSPVLLVAIDPVNRFYAWRTFKYEIPLERIFVPVVFRTYQTEPYKESDWMIISEASENTTQEDEGSER